MRAKSLILVLLALNFLSAAGLTLNCSGQGKDQPGKPAPKPLFRDPIHDGAADPTLIWNRARHEWWMFYTNRRADLASSNVNDVSWVHGTRIGIAISKDHGATWQYHGTANILYGKPDYTHWAPDIVYTDGRYHMFLAIVPGTFKDWNAPRDIIHLVSKDLEKWTYVSKLDVGSDQIIDPSLFHLSNGAWRIWYKDERDDAHIHFAESFDLAHWTPKGAAISDRRSEGPKIFHWKNQFWMIVDAWNGLAVYRSTDLEHWVAQTANLLQTPGHVPTDRTEGHHCDVVVNGDRAFIFYFTHQKDADFDATLPHSAERSVLQVAELHESNGAISVDRDSPAIVNLGPP